MSKKTCVLEPELECLARPQLEALQAQLLQSTVARCYDSMDLYRAKFQQAGLKPSDIRSLADLRRIPFTTKADLRARYPLDGLLSVPANEIVRLHMTSGTTGKPTLSPFTKADTQFAGQMFARFFAAAGCRKGDTVLCLVGYGLFLGGLVVGPAAESLGMLHIPSGGAVSSERQLEFIQDFHPTVMVGTPSFLMHITEVAERKGIALEKLGVRVLIEGAEACSCSTRQRLVEAWQAEVFDVGGTCELFHIYHECADHSGLHLAEDAAIFELVDPATGAAVAVGQPGELVVTTLRKDAMPLLRWRTGDITTFRDDTVCACGRTSRKVDHFSGRVDDMIKIKGVAVYPTQIEEIIRSIAELNESEFQILVNRDFATADMLVVRTELSEALQPIANSIMKSIEVGVRNMLGLSVRIEFVKLGTLPRFTHKAKRVTT